MSIASLTFLNGSQELGDRDRPFDLDGDGDEEFAVPAPGQSSDTGYVYVVPGSTLRQSYNIYDDFRHLVALCALGRDFLGALVSNTGSELDSVINAGDINGDGYDDPRLGRGYRTENLQTTGAAFLVYLGPNFLGDLWDASGTAIDPVYLAAYTSTGSMGARFEGVSQFEEMGQVISAAGDMNDDGYDDLPSCP